MILDLVQREQDTTIAPAVRDVGYAHDIPSDVTAHAFIRAHGDKLQIIVRVPFSAIRDIEFPEDERGYLDIEKLAPLLPSAAKVQIADLMEVHEGSRVLPAPQVSATQISLESDRSFDTFHDALRHVQMPKLPNIANLVWNQVFFDALLEYPIQSDRSDFFVRPGFYRLAARVVTVLRFVEPGGAIRAYEFQGDPGWFPLILTGIKQRGALSRWGSGTFWMASIIFYF